MDAKMPELLPISLFSSGLSMFKMVQVVMVVMTVMVDGGDDGDDGDGEDDGDGDDDDGGDVHKMMDWESADRVVRADLFISFYMMLPPSKTLNTKYLDFAFNKTECKCLIALLLLHPNMDISEVSMASLKDKWVQRARKCNFER